jgi:chromosome partitioning protein
VEVHLVNEVAREQILARVLRQVSGEYDVILIDCQLSLGLPPSPSMRSPPPTEC